MKFEVTVICRTKVIVEADNSDEALEAAGMKAAHEFSPGVDDWYTEKIKIITKDGKRL